MECAPVSVFRLEPTLFCRPRRIWRRAPPVAAVAKYAPIASAIVPGSGQALLGDNRFVGYVAVEALAWWMYAKDISERSARENQFKELAREVARAALQHDVPRRGMVVLRVDA